MNWHYKFFVVFISLVYSSSVTAKPNYWDPKLVPEDKQEQPTETIATPRIKAAPKMPSSAQTSGFCCMLYDVTENGIPENVATSFCSSRKFRTSSIRSLKKWHFNPAILGGVKIRANDQSRIVTYRLTDERGFIIPDSKRLIVHNDQTDFSMERLCKVPIS